MQSGLFKFVDLLTYLKPTKSKTSSLVSLFSLVKTFLDLQPIEESRDLVVFDDTSSLEWLGQSTVDSTRFIRAIFAASNKVSLECMLVM